MNALTALPPKAGSHLVCMCPGASYERCQRSNRDERRVQQPGSLLCSVVKHRARQKARLTVARSWSALPELLPEASAVLGKP